VLPQKQGGMPQRDTAQNIVEQHAKRCHHTRTHSTGGGGEWLAKQRFWRSAPATPHRPSPLKKTPLKEEQRD